MGTQIQKVTFIGGGSWATALAHVLSYNKTDVTLLVRDATLAGDIQQFHCNTKYFPNHILSPLITATTSVEDACNDADVIIYSAAMQHAPELLNRIRDIILPHAIVVNASKGIDECSLQTMSGIIERCLPMHSEHACVLSGPSFAKEVLEDKFTTVVVASHDEASALSIQRLFATPTFKVYRSDDVIGVELAGAIKNVIAIASGIVDEVQQSYNARAGLITRGLAEMTRLGLALGAKQQTFMGLAGMGDLLLTCTGELSRNRHVGRELGKGHTMEAIIAHMENVVEGIYTCNAVYALAQQYGIYMPITTAVYDLLHGKRTVQEIYTLFSTQSHKQEAI